MKLSTNGLEFKVHNHGTSFIGSKIKNYPDNVQSSIAYSSPLYPIARTLARFYGPTRCGNSKYHDAFCIEFRPNLAYENSTHIYETFLYETRCK